MGNITTWVEQRVGWIEINRERKLNALDYETLIELDQVIDSFHLNSSIQCVVITGKGEKAFCAGADIEYYVDIHPINALEFLRTAQRLFSKIENLPKPVIAAVNGYALGGGCELSLACDIRIATENAQFGLPEVNLGLFPGFGGTQRLPRMVGMSIAKQMILTGARLKASKAEQLGLVASVVPLSDLRTHTAEVAAQIVNKSPIGLMLAKDSIHKSFDTDLATGLQHEAANLALVFSSKDAQEGIQAFVQKREPKFIGE